MSVLHRLPWLIVLLAVAGVAWMLVGRGGILDDLGGIDRGTEAEAGGSESNGDEEKAWDEAWDEAPRRVGRPGVRRGDGYLRADGTRGGTHAGGAAARGTRAGSNVRFGGRVTGADGQPAVDVQVVLQPKGGGALVRATTEASGRFATEIPAGRYDVALKAEGMGGLNLPGYLVDGATGIDIEFTLRRAHRLQLDLSRDGTAVVGAHVTANPTQGIGGEATQTDENGTAAFEGLVAGKYRLSATLESGEEIIRTLDLRRDETLKVEVPHGVAIRGTIENVDEGGPVAGAEVAAWVRGPSSTWITASTLTDQDGRYELDVPKGKVGRFEVSASGFAPWPPKKLIKKVLRSLGGVAKGRETERNVSLSRGLTIAGRVTNTDGEGVEDVELSFRPRRGSPLAAKSGEDGEYELAGVRSERYDVVVLSQGWFSDRALRVFVPKLQSGEVHTFDITVETTIELQGKVVHQDKSPAAGTRVWISGGGRLLRAAHNAGRDLETFTDAKGWWRLSDLPASQSVAVRAALGTLEAKPRGIRTNDLPDKPIELRLAPTITLKGTVTDVTSRRPVSGVRVSIRPRGAPGGRTVRTVSTDKQGTFEVFGLIPGTWELTPFRVGYLVAKPQTENLENAEGEREVGLYLDPGLAIAGTVLTVQGRPLRGVRIGVSGTTRAGRRFGRNVMTNAQGVFRVTGIEIGDYRVVARRGGFRNAVVRNLQGGEDRLLIELKARSK